MKLFCKNSSRRTHCVKKIRLKYSQILTHETFSYTMKEIHLVKNAFKDIC
eukprot:UN17937